MRKNLGVGTNKKLREFLDSQYPEIAGLYGNVPEVAVRRSTLSISSSEDNGLRGSAPEIG